MRYSELNEAVEIKDLKSPHYKGAVQVPVEALGGFRDYKHLKAHTAALGLENVEVNTVDGYHTVSLFSNVFTNAELKAKIMAGLKKKTKVEPQATPAAKPSVSPETVLGSIKNHMQGSAGQYANFNPIRKSGDWLEFDVRDWGHWENPEDAQDEEDYDWQNLSASSSKTLEDLIRSFKVKYPTIQIDYETGEKNWIYVRAKAH